MVVMATTRKGLAAFLSLCLPVLPAGPGAGLARAASVEASAAGSVPGRLISARQAMSCQIKAFLHLHPNSRYSSLTQLANLPPGAGSLSPFEQDSARAALSMIMNSADLARLGPNDPLYRRLALAWGEENVANLRAAPHDGGELEIIRDAWKAAIPLESVAELGEALARPDQVFSGSKDLPSLDDPPGSIVDASVPGSERSAEASGRLLPSQGGPGQASPEPPLEPGQATIEIIRATTLSPQSASPELERTLRDGIMYYKDAPSVPGFIRVVLDAYRSLIRARPDLVREDSVRLIVSAVKTRLKPSPLLLDLEDGEDAIYTAHWAIREAHLWAYRWAMETALTLAEIKPAVLGREDAGDISEAVQSTRQQAFMGALLTMLFLPVRLGFFIGALIGAQIIGSLSVLDTASNWPASNWPLILTIWMGCFGSIVQWFLTEFPSFSLTEKLERRLLARLP